jgi:uncharacterized protein YndB with AHSA1/START domain
MSDGIHQEEVFGAAPEAVFAVLTDGAQFAEATGAPATIDSSTGGEFALFGGAISGRSVEVVASQRLVQAWRPGNWDPGVYSLVRFELTAEGDGTRVVLDHTGFPESNAEHLAAGWDANYWQALHKLFG